MLGTPTVVSGDAVFAVTASNMLGSVRGFVDVKVSSKARFRFGTVPSPLANSPRSLP